jgi:electron-transferring-flavoprotein dehydrogenase
MDVDIVCVGFGPATAGFLTTLSKNLLNPDGTPALESAAQPGLPPQVVCYERAGDVGFGVSGIVTRARGLRASFPDLDPKQIPMASNVTEEKVVYLLDPVGASRRSLPLRAADACLRAFRGLWPIENEAVELPWTPAFLHKQGGLVLSMGQFMQWVSAQVQSTGTVQIWPGTPVSEVLVQPSGVHLCSGAAASEHVDSRESDGTTQAEPAAHGHADPSHDADHVIGIRLLDQGLDKKGNLTEGFMPGMDIHAALTVIGDGPVGPLGQQLDAHFGLPQGHHSSDWAVGMKFVIDLPQNCSLQPGTVLHTFGYPEPEIFGFLYVHPDRVASLGIFVPSWFDNPVRTTYRYLQHWMLHPYLWRHLQGGKLRSWGAKTLGESGRRGEPHLVGNGYARIGEGSGSTNVLTGSGVDEAWTTGTQLAESVLDLWRAKKPFTKENLEQTYVKLRRSSWVEEEGRIAEKSRDGFQKGVVRGMLGMALAGLSKGSALSSVFRILSRITDPARPYEHVPLLEEYYRGRIPRAEIEEMRNECEIKGTSLHAALMHRVGWPAIPYDGRLLVSHQDALLLGGKVQAPPGYADHVVFLYPAICETCCTKICIELCSGQAITPGQGGVPAFDSEKCVHCGACYWNCSQPIPGNPERMNIAFRAGAGGLHSAEN